PGLELLAGGKEGVVAPGADVGARVLGGEEAAGPGALGAVVAEDLERLGAQPRPPLFFGEVELVDHGGEDTAGPGRAAGGPSHRAQQGTSVRSTVNGRAVTPA